MHVLQEDVEPQQQEESGPFEEVYKDSSTFLKVGAWWEHVCMREQNGESAFPFALT